MTTFEKIIKAIKPFGYPYSPGVYTGSENKWFIYNYVDDYGTNHADDEPQSVVNRIQLHFFLPIEEDYIRIKKDRKSVV